MSTGADAHRRAIGDARAVPDLSDLGSEAGGVWVRADAVAASSPGLVRQRLLSGQWQVPFPGVYADAGQVLGARQLAFAAALAAAGKTSETDGVLCGRSAARLWMLPLIDDDDPATGAQQRFQHDVHTRTGHGRLHGAEHTVVRRRLTLLPGEVGQFESGLWATSALRTAADSARWLTAQALVCLLDAGVRDELFTVQELHAEAVRRRCRRLRDGVLRVDGRSESPNETLARLLLLPAIPTLVPQVSVRDRSGRITARHDLADEQVRFAVEMDGREGHTGAALLARDQRRDWVSGTQRWWVERGTWYDVRCRPQEFVARVTTRHAAWSRRAA